MKADKVDTVILYGDKKDAQIKNILMRILPERFRVNLISEQLVQCCGNGHIVNLIDTQVANEIRVPNSILVLKSRSNIHSLRYMDCATNVIINSMNTKSISKLSKSLNHVYTCGFSSKDYVTFSSREEDKAVVALQRSITLSDGKICDPLELPCNISGKIEDYSILASTLTLIMLDLFDENS